MINIKKDKWLLLSVKKFIKRQDIIKLGISDANSQLLTEQGHELLAILTPTP
jgi:hypothetical protein